MVEGKVKAVRLKTKSMHTCSGDDQISFEMGRIKDRQFLNSEDRPANFWSSTRLTLRN